MNSYDHQEGAPLPGVDVSRFVGESPAPAASAREVHRPLYSIRAVAGMLGVPVATLRTWEDRYALVVPRRNANGHRLYSRDQVALLRFVKARLDEGSSAGDAHRLLAERLDAGLPIVEAPVDGDRLVILLAAGDPYGARLQEYFLTTEGFAVEVVADAHAAHQACLQGPPAAVVIDLLISGGAGVQLCQTIKAEIGVPVIAVSVLDGDEIALRAGADAFLIKPLDPLALVSTVRDLIGSSALLRPATRPQRPDTRP